MSIASEITDPNRVDVKAIAHRGREVWMVTFAYNVDLYKCSKEVGGQYSRTYQGWWWPTSEMDGVLLRNKLFEKCTLWEAAKEGQETTADVGISNQVKDKVREMEIWMRQKRYGESSVKTYTDFVRQLFSTRTDLARDAIKSEDITDYNFSHFISGKKSYSSQNQWINAIKIYLKVHKLDRNGVQDIERPRKATYLPDVLTLEEVKGIFRRLPNLKHRALLMLIYSCGLRIGEALSLKPDDIRSKEGLIYIRGGKGRKDRCVPLSARLLEELRRYYRSYKPADYLFEGQKGGRYSNKSAAQVLKRAVAQAGIDKMTLHTRRHSYATHLTNRGVNIQYLQEILGHDSPKTTMLYTHLSGKDIRKVRSPLDDMDV